MTPTTLGPKTTTTVTLSAAGPGGWRVVRFAAGDEREAIAAVLESVMSGEIDEPTGRVLLACIVDPLGESPGQPAPAYLPLPGVAAGGRDFERALWVLRAVVFALAAAFGFGMWRLTA